MEVIIGLIILPLFAFFSLAAGVLGASVSFASAKRRGGVSGAAKRSAGLFGMAAGIGCAWAATFVGLTQNGGNGIYLYGVDALGFACIGGFALLVLACFVAYWYR